MKTNTRSNHYQVFTYEFTGSRLCLDFANTVYRRLTGQPRECLNSYKDLVSWSRQAGLLNNADGRYLLRKAMRQPAQAAAAFERAIALREAIYRTFSAVAAGRQPRETDLAALNASLSQALTLSRIKPKGDGFAWDWAGHTQALDRMLWPVARSVPELLTSTDLGALRECAADYCGWLFMDNSRNQSRRWCDMKTCGNRTKARRHYERKKSRL